MAKLIWLADVLRNAGLKVVEEPGWEKRGGEMGAIKGVLLHHTAGPKSGNMPSLQIVRDGRPGLRGPLAHLALGRDGTFYVVSGGKSNHAGRGHWRGLVNGNSHLIGIEAENTGVGDDPWPQEQVDAYVKGVAAILEFLKLPAYCAIGHKEWAPKRKIDPSFDMNDFRERIEEVMARKKKAKKEEVVEIMPADDDVLELSEMPDPPEEEAVPPDFEYSLYKETPVPEEKPSKTIPKGLSMTGASYRGLYAKDILESLGWKDYQAAAMIGNAMHESGDDLNTEAKGDYMVNKRIVPEDTPGAKWSAFGICQWRHGRLDNLKKFAEDHGKKNNIKNPISDLEVQVRFIDWELRNTEKVAGKMLSNSTDIMEALRAGISYERPRGWSIESPERGLGWKERLVNAYKLLRK